jgi:hypothetical protein
MIGADKKIYVWRKLYQCEEYSFGQKTVAILGTLIWPNTVVSSVTVRRFLYRNNFHKRVPRKNIRIREVNACTSKFHSIKKKLMTHLNTWQCSPWTLLFSAFVLEMTCASS